MSQAVGIVAIGRNEGERLRACISSAARESNAVVYVDSGSTDDSVAMASSMGATVVNLDMSIPFTAARARNAGFARLLAMRTDVDYVFFIDGDCEIIPAFVPAVLSELNDRPDVAVACGRVRERHADRSVYNRLCDLEWDNLAGETQSCGGNAVHRVSAFKAVGGFNESMIAGEEPEMCVRLRQRGFKILSIAQDMVWHDAAMTRFSQWWRRNVRAGHAYAEGAAMHGAPPERHWVREVRSNDFWGLFIPLMSIVLASFTYGAGLALWLLAYAVLALKIYRHARRRFGKNAALYTFFIVLGKIPQALGQLKYRLSRLRGKRSQIIEYKTAAAGSP